MNLLDFGSVLREGGYWAGLGVVTVLGLLMGILCHIAARINYGANRTEGKEVLWGFLVLLGFTTCATYILFMTLKKDSFEIAAIGFTAALVADLVLVATLIFRSEESSVLLPSKLWIRNAKSKRYIVISHTLIFAVFMLVCIPELALVQLTSEERARYYLHRQSEASQQSKHSFDDFHDAEEYGESPEPFWSGLFYLRSGNIEKALKNLQPHSSTVPENQQLFWKAVTNYYEKNYIGAAKQFSDAGEPELKIVALAMADELDLQTLEDSHTRKADTPKRFLSVDARMLLHQIAELKTSRKNEQDANKNDKQRQWLLQKYSYTLDDEMLNAVAASGPKTLNAPKIYLANFAFYPLSYAWFLTIIFVVNALLRDFKEIRQLLTVRTGMFSRFVDYIEREEKPNEPSIVIAVNVTPGMQPMWDALKNYVPILHENLLTRNFVPHLIILAFGENEKGVPFLFVSHPVYDPKKLARFMKRVKCNSHGEFDQPVEQVLKVLLDLDVAGAILLGELPPHGVVDFTKPKQDYRLIAGEMAKKRVPVFTISLSSWLHTNETFAEIASLTNASFFRANNSGRAMNQLISYCELAWQRSGKRPD